MLPVFNPVDHIVTTHGAESFIFHLAYEKQNIMRCWKLPTSPIDALCSTLYAHNSIHLLTWCLCQTDFPTKPEWMSRPNTIASWKGFQLRIISWHLTPFSSSIQHNFKQGLLIFHGIIIVASFIHLHMIPFSNWSLPNPSPWQSELCSWLFAVQFCWKRP